MYIMMKMSTISVVVCTTIRTVGLVHYKTCFSKVHVFSTSRKSVPGSINLVEYLCKIEVVPATEVSINLLSLSAPPRIISTFLPNIVIVEGQSTSFRCVAEGYPAPTITWQLNSRDIENGDNPHFEVNSTVNERDSGWRLRTVTSYLKTRSASDSVSGEVKCTASPPLLHVSTDLIRRESSCMSTQLSVLGN